MVVHLPSVSGDSTDLVTQPLNVVLGELLAIRQMGDPYGCGNRREEGKHSVSNPAVAGAGMWLMRGGCAAAGPSLDSIESMPRTLDDSCRPSLRVSCTGLSATAESAGSAEPACVWVGLLSVGQRVIETVEGPPGRASRLH